MSSGKICIMLIAREYGTGLSEERRAEWFTPVDQV